VNAYQSPNEDRLRAGARHLSYEIRRFYHQWVLLLALAGRLPREQEEANGIAGLDLFVRSSLFVATLEAWLVHVRALLMAFRQSRRGPRAEHDILFRDYLAAEDWERVRADLVPDAALESRIQEIGTLLAHASYERSDPRFSDPGWPGWGQSEYGAVHRRLVIWRRTLHPSRDFFGELLRLIDTPPTDLHAI
jgi:hypothetical protein